MKQEYALENFGQHWKPVSGFLFSNADTLRLTRSKWSEIGLLYVRKKAKDCDPKFQAVLARYTSEFIRKEINNKLHNDVTQFKWSRFEHYYFKLSDQIRTDLLKKEFVIHPQELDFYGFEDPTFYKNDKLICSIISHENMAIFELTPKQTDELKSVGITLDKIEN